MSESKDSLSFTCYYLLLIGLPAKYLSPFNNIKTISKKLRLSIGAKYTVNIKYLHPAKLGSDTITNIAAHTQAEKLPAIKQDNKNVNKHQRSVVEFPHNYFGINEIYCGKDGYI